MRKLFTMLLAFVLVLSTFVGCDVTEKLGLNKKVQHGFELHEVDLVEHLIYDQNDIQVVVTSLDYSEDAYINVNFEVHNASDKDVRVCTDYFEANGLYLDRHAFVDEYCICPAGEDATDTVKIARTRLDSAHICHLKEFDISLHIENGHFEEVVEEDHGHDHEHEPEMQFVVDGVIEEATPEIVVHTNCDADYTQEIDNDGTVLVDNEYAYLVLRDLYINAGGYTTISTYLDNHADSMMRVKFYIHKVNGMDYENDGRVSMLNGHDGFPTCTLFGLLQNELGIKKIESAEISCKLYVEKDGESTLVYETEHFTLAF